MKTAWVIVAGILCVLAGLGWNLFQIYQHGLDTEKYFGLRKSELLRLIEINNSIIDCLESHRDKWSTCHQFGLLFRDRFESETRGEFDTVKNELEQYFNDSVNQKLNIGSPRQTRQKLTDEQKNRIIDAVKKTNEELKCPGI